MDARRSALMPLLAFATLLAALPARAALPPGIDDAAFRMAALGSFPELFELLALPNDSINAADIQKNAAWLETAFQKRGFSTRQLENKGRPLVFAELSGNRPGRKTVLFYMHFDGQPVVPSQWSQKDPWQPVVKRRGADGKWSEADRAELMRPDFDPELRVFAHAASDDKGPSIRAAARRLCSETAGSSPSVSRSMGPGARSTAGTTATTFPTPRRGWPRF